MLFPIVVRHCELCGQNLLIQRNMYDTGNGVCAWYRLWKCMACLYAGRRETAESELELLLAETGCWGELFEIYEKSMRPFFATAEGIFLSLLHQLYKP